MIFLFNNKIVFMVSEKYREIQFGPADSLVIALIFAVYLLHYPQSNSFWLYGYNKIKDHLVTVKFHKGLLRMFLYITTAVFRKFSWYLSWVDESAYHQLGSSGSEVTKDINGNGKVGGWVSYENSRSSAIV